MIGCATNDTVWDWDLRTNEVWHNQGLMSVFGHRDDQDTQSVDWWLGHIHPEERAAVTSAIAMAITRGAETWSREYRFRRGDGTYAHVLARGYVLYDTQRAVRMVGVLLDLSDRKRISRRRHRRGLVRDTDCRDWANCLTERGRIDRHCV